MNEFDPEFVARIEELLGRLQIGRAATVQLIELVDNYRNYLLKIGNDRLRNVDRAAFGASDIFQEAWVLVRNHLGQFQGKTELEFRAWLKTIYTRELTRKYHEAEQTAKAEQVAAQIAPPVDDSPSTELRTQEDRRALESALSGLPEAERAIVVLRDMHEFGFKQIGYALGITEDQARYRYHAAKLDMLH